nr:MAG: polyprotein [Plant associated polerovirus 2]
MAFQPTILIFFLVAFLLSSQSSSGAFKCPSTATDYQVRLTNHTMSFAMLPELDTNLKPIVTSEQQQHPYVGNPHPTYADILQMFSVKVSEDARKLYSEGSKTLRNSCASGWAELTRLSQIAFEGFLWTVIFLWSSVLWQITVTIWHLVQTYTAAVVSLLLLYFLSLSLVRAVRWIFGGCPLYLLTGIFKTLKMISRAVWYRRRYTEEKACEGYTTYTIPQSPPKNSVLMIEYADGSHSGYATCVRLYNGENALVTAYHVYDQVKENGKLVSTRNGTKVPMNLFQEITGSPKADLAILRGPPNWEGTLAVKSVQMVNAQQLAKSKTTIYHYNGQNWMASNSEIVGHDKLFITMLSQTEAGFSGSPYFNGKNLVGVHVGGAKKDNFNLMAPIPNIPGLTSPSYVFETTAPTGRVFMDLEIDEYSKLFKSRAKAEAEFQLNFKSKHGNWADDEDTHFYECGDTQFPHLEDPDLGQEARDLDKDTTPVVTKSGNGKGSTVCQTNGQDLHTPTKEPVDGPKMLEGIVQSMAEKINISSIEKEVIRQLIAKTMKQKPRRARRRAGPKPTTSPATLTTNTAGKYQPPHKRSQDSKPAVPYPNTTTQSKNKAQYGVKHSSASTPTWRPKQKDLAGPSSVPKLN